MTFRPIRNSKPKRNVKIECAPADEGGNPVEWVKETPKKSATAFGLGQPRTVHVACDGVITSSVAFGIHHLSSMITECLQKYPSVQVDVTLNDRFVDLIEEGFDLAIRVATQIDPGPVARRLVASDS